MKSIIPKTGAAAVFLCALSFTIPAVAQPCVAPNYAGVKVRLLDPSPQVSSAQNIKQINAKAKSHGLLKRGNLVLGLTQAEIQTTMDTRYLGAPQGSKICLNIERIEASFGHTALRVLVPREYARHSCQYKTVLKHEMEHVRINREGVRKYAKILKQELDQVVWRLNPQQVRAMKSGQKQIERQLQKVMQSVTARFNQEVRQQHAVIDKPGGPYDASGACRNW